jgi:hypothetical protein
MKSQAKQFCKIRRSEKKVDDKKFKNRIEMELKSKASSNKIHESS